MRRYLWRESDARPFKIADQIDVVVSDLTSLSEERIRDVTAKSGDERFRSQY